MRIVIVVQGRFHAFGLAEALIALGHDVRLLTNYPRSVVRRFGVPPSAVINCVSHGVVSRIVERLGLQHRLEPFLHGWFSRWAAAQCSRLRADVVHAFSGVAEELFSSLPDNQLKTLVRGSSHILTQHKLLADEERRVACELDKPTPWMIERELREYQMADVVVVLSSFCHESFLEHGFPAAKLETLTSAVSTRAFRPAPEVISERIRRVSAGESLRVLTVGALSYRKGAYDYAQIVRALPEEQFTFRFVGSVLPEARAVARELSGRVDFLGKLPQDQLSAQYAWGDVFLFPTIEDGFPSVLAQACAAGLPILTTPNGAGHDLVKHATTGWVLAPRAPEAFAEQLFACDKDRASVCDMIRRIYHEFTPRDYNEMAADFVSIVQSHRQPGSSLNHGSRC